MTISLKCFEKSEESKITESFWCNDGMILILQRKPTEEYGTSASIKPSELKQIIETYREDATEPLLEIQEVRPGLMACNEIITVKVKNGLIEIENKKNMLGSGFFSRGPLYISIDDAKTILQSSVDERDVYERDIGIAPILGLNCREEEKEVYP